jgi:hypothetical protein
VRDEDVEEGGMGRPRLTVPSAEPQRLRTSRSRGRDLGLGFALLLLACGAPGVEAQGWTSGASAFLFDPPDDDAFVSPIVDADRGALHLEARYNYEDLKTGSVFIGRTFGFGTGVAGSVVPLLGLVLGRTDAVAPGVNLDIAWRGIAFSTESEVSSTSTIPTTAFSTPGSRRRSR